MALPPGSDFWREQARRFAAVRSKALEHSRQPFSASYAPLGWGLDEVRAFRGRAVGRWLLDDGSDLVVDRFKSIAGVCAVALGSDNRDTAWVDWLDCLRREAVDFKDGILVETYRALEPLPEADTDIVIEGLAFMPLEVLAEAEPARTSSQLAEVTDVCSASERVCERLADEALKAELTGSRAQSQVTTASPTPASQAVSVPTDVSRTLTLKQGAQLLRVSEDTLIREWKQGRVELFKVGRRWRVKASEIARMRDQSKKR